MNALFNRHCHNLAGKIRVSSSTEGVLGAVVAKVPQTFRRFVCEDLSADADTRFEFFLESVLPEVSTPLHTHVLIFIPSYFDYVRVRNYFRKEKMSFSQICEYTSRANVSRSRSNFYHGRTRFLLYTQRHYYHFRLRIRGVKHAVFYAPPDYPQFYSEILNFIDPADTSATSITMFAKHDMFALERVAGTTRAHRILKAEKPVHLFV